LLNKLTSKAAHLLKGEAAERCAHQFLVKQGLELVCRNYRCRSGELDLIMLDQQTLVFIEVRFRKNDKYGSAVETITAAKQSRIIAAAQYYLATRQTDRPMRFDVVAISGDGRIDWIKNAF
jgi:putative endonuclease